LFRDATTIALVKLKNLEKNLKGATPDKEWDKSQLGNIFKQYLNLLTAGTSNPKVGSNDPILTLFPRTLEEYGLKTPEDPSVDPTNVYSGEFPKNQMGTRLLVLEFLKYWALGLRYDEVMSGYTGNLDANHMGNAASDFLKVVSHDELNHILYKEDLPALLARTSAAADAGLKNVADAFATDLQDICMPPLMKLASCMSEKNKDNDRYGIQLIGKTTVVVTAGQASTVGTTVQTALPTRPSLDLGQAITNATPVVEAIAGSDEVTKSGFFTPGTAAILALGLDTPATTYSALTPSVSVGVRPSVFKSGDSARLQMNFQVNVNAVLAANNAAPGGSNLQPYNMVQNQTVTSDVAVDALDLFTLSSTNLEVTGPGGYSWSLGPLQYVPGLGNLFHGPERSKTENYDTLLLTVVTILPRSLDVAGNFLH
jgi:hypothetical protein